MPCQWRQLTEVPETGGQISCPAPRAFGAPPIRIGVRAARCPEMEHLCVSFLDDGREPAFRSFPNQAARAAELPAPRFRRGWSLGPRAGPGVRASRRWRRNRNPPGPRAGEGFRRRRGGRPITGVIHDSPHLLEPPVRAARTAPASARRSEPRLVLKTQFQLAADHTSPFSSPQGRVRRTESRPAGETGAQRAPCRDVGPCPGIRQ